MRVGERRDSLKDCFTVRRQVRINKIRRDGGPSLRIGNQGLLKLPITELYGISALVRAAVNPVQVAGYRPLLHTTDKLDDGNKVGKRSECLESIHMVHLLYQQNGRSNRVTYVNNSPCGLPIYYSTVNVREGPVPKVSRSTCKKS